MCRDVRINDGMGLLAKLDTSFPWLGFGSLLHDRFTTRPGDQRGMVLLVGEAITPVFFVPDRHRPSPWRSFATAREVGSYAIRRPPRRLSACARRWQRDYALRRSFTRGFQRFGCAGFGGRAIVRIVPIVSPLARSA